MIVFLDPAPEVRAFQQHKMAGLMAAALTAARVNLNDNNAVLVALTAAGFSDLTPETIKAAVRRADRTKRRIATALRGIRLPASLRIMEAR